MSHGGPPDPELFIRGILDQRLDSYQAWPANLFKLECEEYGLYQNKTGAILQKLHTQGLIGEAKIGLRGADRPFIIRPHSTGVDEPEIVEAARAVYNFLTENGHFADLAAYTALCKVHSELHSQIDIDVLPEGSRPALLHSPDRDPDGVILLPSEYVPVEVYNGRDYLGPGGRKANQVRDLSSFYYDETGELKEEEELNSHPMLINRRSDDKIKKVVRRRNGMVVDTDCIIACEETHGHVKEQIETLNLSGLIHWLPRLETADGVVLDGEQYVGTTDHSIIRPPSKMASAAEKLPIQYLDRIRGGVQLQYVNSLYRRSSDPTKKDACLVVQTIYNQLLRNGGWDRDTALEEGWEETRRQYRRLKSADQRKSMILDETSSFLNQLQEENIITERHGGLHARNATHPQQSLSFR